MHAGEANANGYELVRQLTLEFSLRSRAEALTVRASLASKTFTLSSSETSPGSMVSDTIRRWILNVPVTPSSLPLCRHM